MRHVHTIPVDPSLTPEEAWKEICIMGLRTTYTGTPTWAVVECDGEECSTVLADTPAKTAEVCRCSASS